MTRISRSICRATIIKIPVTKIEITGVLKRFETLDIPLGIKLSRLRARGYREAAIIPAFAVVIKAINEAIVIAMYPGCPANFRAASEIGSIEFLKSEGFKIPLTEFGLDNIDISNLKQIQFDSPWDHSHGEIKIKSISFKR